MVDESDMKDFWKEKCDVGHCHEGFVVNVYYIYRIKRLIE